jgi:hypothetical protein
LRPIRRWPPGLAHRGENVLSGRPQRATR